MADDNIIYDEGDVPQYELPELLVCGHGKPVNDKALWQHHRRQELVELFEQQMFGRMPGRPETTTVDEYDGEDGALDGLATRKQIRLTFANGSHTASMDLLLYLPADRSGPTATFLGLNFFGNQSIHRDPAITVTPNWVRDRPFKGIANHRASEESRGISANRWPAESIVKRGYGVATAYYGDLDPDFDDGYQNGVHPLFYKEGQSRPEADEWGAIGAWAWGLSRALDHLESDADVDASSVAVMGHSRLGKTALWAGAMDERFAIVISNESGCGGAALSRRCYGETLHEINTRFPHWFCDNFHAYNGKEHELPIDQHMLIALSAPQPVYVCSAEEDRWSDPRGEFLGALHASPAYELFGAVGMPATEMPGLNEPVAGAVGYHIRPGKHEVYQYDWDRFMDFADLHLAGRKAPA